MDSVGALLAAVVTEIVAVLGALVFGGALRGVAGRARIRTLRKKLAVVRWSIAALPLAWLALFAVLIVRARVVLGSWPRAGHAGASRLFFDYIPPTFDPAELGLHASLLRPLGVAAFLSLPVLVMIRPVDVQPERPTRAKQAFAFNLAGLALLFALWAFDPGQFCAWWNG